MSTDDRTSRQQQQISKPEAAATLRRRLPAQGSGSLVGRSPEESLMTSRKPRATVLLTLAAVSALAAVAFGAYAPPVGAQRLRAQIFVTEAANDLKVFFETRDHQNLFEELRRLRKRIEAAVV